MVHKFNANIDGSMGTDYSMPFKAVFGHFHDVRARPDLHNVMPFKPCITFEQHVSGCVCKVRFNRNVYDGNNRVLKQS